MRNVRNFWIEVEVDGRKEKIETGPRNADGGFMITIGMRTKKGDMGENKLKVYGYVKNKETKSKERDLIIWVEDTKGQISPAVRMNNE